MSQIKIERHKERKKLNQEIIWEEKDVKDLAKRISNLRPDQIITLSFLVGVKFSFKDLDAVASEIIKKKHNSVNVDAIIYEASSKEDLLFWLSFFEKYNKED